MIATVWNNGAYHPSGAGYGMKISKIDRDNFFKKEWGKVILKLGNDEITTCANINKASFWSNCRELISKDIGVWLIKEGRGTWEKSKPHKIEIVNITENIFKVELL